MTRRAPNRTRECRLIIGRPAERGAHPWQVREGYARMQAASDQYTASAHEYQLRGLIHCQVGLPSISSLLHLRDLP